MLAYTAKRLLLAIAVAFTISALVFSLLYMTGDPATALAGENSTDEAIEKLRKAYGFDRPIYVQYFSWLGLCIPIIFGISQAN